MTIEQSRNSSIGSILRRLRKERGWTQEAMATKLGLTAQAVSKWEQEVTSPDIAQLVPLATLFGVSADVLLGIAPDAMQKAIDAQKAADLTDAVDNVTSLAAWEALARRYPHSHEIRAELARAHQYRASELSYEEGVAHYRKAVWLLESLLDDCTDDRLRFDAIYDLNFLYSQRLRDVNNACRIAEMGAPMGSTKEEMLARITEFPGHTYWAQVVFRNSGEAMAWALIQMTESADTEVKLRAYRTALAVLDLTYNDGNLAWIGYVYYELYRRMAALFAKTGDRDAFYEVLERWYAVTAYDDALPIGIYTYPDNPFMNEIVYNRDGLITNRDRDRMLVSLEDEIFDPYRREDAFAAFLEKVRTMPGVEE